MVRESRLSPRAKRDVRKIHAFYEEEIGKEVADRISDGILNVVELLASQPHLGHTEPDLEIFPQCFRTYVYIPNYKIVYWVEDDIVKVATVFDCRRRPENLYYIINTKTDWVCEPQTEYKRIPQEQ